MPRAADRRCLSRSRWWAMLHDPPVGRDSTREERKEGMKTAKFQIGQVVKHRFFPFRGVIFDVDPEFNNTEEWWLSIPEEIRPEKDQPYYHLLAENDETTYTAYVSEQNLVPDKSGDPVGHPEIAQMFGELQGDHYAVRRGYEH
jgi:heat shock protein HspQ